MSKQHTKYKWDALLTGVAMLGCVITCLIVWTANEIGLGKALALTVLVLFAASWIVTGIILVLHGAGKI